MVPIASHAPPRAAAPAAPVAALGRYRAPVTFGPVTLAVRDLEGMTDFYRQVVGLTVLASDGQRRHLGRAAGPTQLILAGDPTLSLASPHQAGLFHVAFRLGDRVSLAHWLSHALERAVPLTGRSDHGVSEALYLRDPEGNGVEIYVDRPLDQWPRHGTSITMKTLPLDTDALLATTPTSPSPWVFDGDVGHIHLQVGDIPRAEAFYQRVLGLTLTARYPGGRFFAWGDYHHHLATNVWNSQGAGTPPQGTTGLRQFSVHIQDPQLRRDIHRRAQAHGAHIQGEVGAIDGYRLEDPWGIAMVVLP